MLLQMRAGYYGDALRLLACTAVPADRPDGNTNRKPTDHEVWSALPFELLTRFALLSTLGKSAGPAVSPKGSPGPKRCLIRLQSTSRAG